MKMIARGTLGMGLVFPFFVSTFFTIFIIIFGKFLLNHNIEWHIKDLRTFGANSPNL